MKEDLILVGASIEIIELANSIDYYNILGIIDNNLRGEYFNIPILGSDNDINYIHSKYSNAKMIITLDDPTLKEKLYELYKSAGFGFAALISPNAIVSPYSKISEGAIIERGVNISPLVEIGLCSKINVYANIMHNGFVGKFCTIAPNVVTLGYVKIGDNIFLGANSTILSHIVIENNAVVGAGAVVTKNVPSHTCVKGVPAKPYKNTNV